MQAWRLHKPLLLEDPFYSSCLSLEEPYQPAFAPRRRASWSKTCGARPAHLLLLARERKKGNGAPLVIRQAADLASRGFQVTIGGANLNSDLDYPGCGRLDVADPRSAMAWAIKNNVDAVIAHDSPFCSVARWAGHAIPVVTFDYGDPPPEACNDAEAMRAILNEKDFCLQMCAKVFAVRMESEKRVARRSMASFRLEILADRMKNRPKPSPKNCGVGSGQ